MKAYLTNLERDDKTRICDTVACYNRGRMNSAANEKLAQYNGIGVMVLLHLAKNTKNSICDTVSISALSDNYKATIKQL